jgi:hypothetical protein
VAVTGLEDMIRRGWLMDPRGADDLEGLVGRFKAELVLSESQMTCSTEVCTGTTSRCTTILKQTKCIVDSRR